MPGTYGLGVNFIPLKAISLGAQPLNSRATVGEGILLEPLEILKRYTDFIW